MGKQFILKLFVGLALLAGASAPVLAQENVDDAEESILALIDVPLMPELDELVETGVLFDKPDGRFVEVELVGDVSIKAVRDYYRASMENWGWQLGADSGDEMLIYQKDGEVLSMEISKDGNEVWVKIRLKPIS